MKKFEVTFYAGRQWGSITIERDNREEVHRWAKSALSFYKHQTDLKAFGSDYLITLITANIDAYRIEEVNDMV